MDQLTKLLAKGYEAMAEMVTTGECATCTCAVCCWARAGAVLAEQLPEWMTKLIDEAHG